MPKSNKLDRPPRIQPELPQGIEAIPAPPKEDDNPQPLWQALVPIVTIVGYVLVSASGQGSNLAFMVPMALTVFISTGIQLYNTVQHWQTRAQKREAYKHRLVEMRREMVASHDRQRSFYEYTYPAPEGVLSVRGDRHDNRGGSRLWERRPSDQDFGVARIGLGVRESTVKYQISQQTENEENPLLADAERLAKDSLFVDNVPISIDLYESAKEREKSQEKDKEEDRNASQSRIQHTLGISGSPKDVYESIYSLLAHLVTFHSPNELQLAVLGMHQAASKWEWLYALPHAQINVEKGQYRVYFEDCERIYAPISGTIVDITVSVGDPIPANHVVAKIQADQGGAVHNVHSPVAGRVQGFGRVPAASDEASTPIDVNRRVEAGTLLLRLEDFSLTMQQLEEELDPRKERQKEFGKKRKREVAGVPRFWKENIWIELDRRARRLRDKDENDQTDITLPFLLTIVDMLDARPDLEDVQNPLKDSYLDDLESEAAISLLMPQGLQLGSAIIFLVPQRSKVPGGCQAVIELVRDADDKLKFLYAETGVNSPRFVGVADSIINQDNKPNRKLADFAKAVAEWEVRRSYGADVPRAVGLLPLYDAQTITALDIKGKWQESREPKRADWPKVPLGMLAGQEPRYLHFFADADGVHGMIAGSTGSGKSELLMTLILSLAIQYDPSMVNFVLVDFKGGAAFEPFKSLPHVVDVVTNLRGNAVARMFAAINAELNRRQQVNQDTDMKDIVRYKKAGLHLQRSDNYPHLFIIIDEFAEMIANNAEYKAQLDSITRLGRALGVSLILAAQRPTGVTDQMRANIKFRICLRVETREESSELLRLPDASYLPSIPGRGYLQVGSESLELIQVGYTGQPYIHDDYDPLERYDNRAVIWEDDLGKEEDEPTYDVLVRRMQQWTTEEYGIDRKQWRPIWRKPWPDPLPDYLTLDQSDGIEEEYLQGDERDIIWDKLGENAPFVLSPAIYQWQHGSKTTWDDLDWEREAMRTVIGLIDDPSNARLLPLRIDFTQGHHMILGAAGWGKSKALQTVITSLLATHTPDDLHLYMLDFGSRSMQIFEDMPHTGAYIVAHEKERVERLLRILEQIIDIRKEYLNQANVANITEYNLRTPAKRHRDIPDKLPAILVAIDNFAEFKEAYDSHLEVLISLVREGLANGVFFIVTGEQSSAIGKLFNLVPERITLKLADDGEYSTIVGRGAHPVDEIAGRGLRRVERTPLDVQIAVPLGYDEETGKSELDCLADFLVKLKKAARDEENTPKYSIPLSVDILELWSALPDLLNEYRQRDTATTLQVVVGRADYDLSPLAIKLDAKPHFIVTGPPASGKTTALQTWILSLAELYTPEEVAIVMVDYQGEMADYGGEQHTLDELPHMLMPIISDTSAFRSLVEHLENEFLNHPERQKRDIFVIVDNYDGIAELASDPDPLGDPMKRLKKLAQFQGKNGLHFVVCGLRESLSADELVRHIAANRSGLAMDAESAESSPFYGSVPRSYSQMQLPRGRGFVVTPGKVSLVQVAAPYSDPTLKSEELDRWVDAIRRKPGYSPLSWLPLVKRSTDGTGSVKYPNTQTKLTLEQREQLIQKLADKMQVPAEALSSSISDDEALVNTAQNYGITLDD